MRPSPAPLALALALGCAPASPFEGPGYDPERGLLTDAPGPFLAVVTEATVAEGQRGPFGDRAEDIEAELIRAPGLVGASLRGELLGDARWTLSVWEDGAALGRFVGGEAHARAIQDADALTDEVRTARWELGRAEVPPDWDEALERLEAEGGGY